MENDHHHDPADTLREVVRGCRATNTVSRAGRTSTISSPAPAGRQRTSTTKVEREALQQQDSYLEFSGPARRPTGLQPADLGKLDSSSQYHAPAGSLRRDQRPIILKTLKAIRESKAIATLRFVTTTNRMAAPFSTCAISSISRGYQSPAKLLGTTTLAGN